MHLTFHTLWLSWSSRLKFECFEGLPGRLIDIAAKKAAAAAYNQTVLGKLLWLNRLLKSCVMGILMFELIASPSFLLTNFPKSWTATHLLLKAMQYRRYMGFVLPYSLTLLPVIVQCCTGRRSRRNSLLMWRFLFKRTVVTPLIQVYPLAYSSSLPLRWLHYLHGIADFLSGSTATEIMALWDKLRSRLCRMWPCSSICQCSPQSVSVWFPQGDTGVPFWQRVRQYLIAFATDFDDSDLVKIIKKSGYDILGFRPLKTSAD